MKTRTEPNPQTLFILRTSPTADNIQYNISVMKSFIVTDLKKENRSILRMSIPVAAECAFAGLFLVSRGQPPRGGLPHWFVGANNSLP
jgi:hypothetical protein